MTGKLESDQSCRLLGCPDPELEPPGEAFKMIRAQSSSGRDGWFGAGLIGGVQTGSGAR